MFHLGNSDSSKLRLHLGSTLVGTRLCLLENYFYLIFELKMMVFIMTILKDENVPNCLSYNSF